MTFFFKHLNKEPKLNLVQTSPIRYLTCPISYCRSIIPILITTVNIDKEISDDVFLYVSISPEAEINKKTRLIYLKYSLIVKIEFIVHLRAHLYVIVMARFNKAATVSQVP